MQTKRPSLGKVGDGPKSGLWKKMPSLALAPTLLRSCDRYKKPGRNRGSRGGGRDWPSRTRSKPSSQRSNGSTMRRAAIGGNGALVARFQLSLYVANMALICSRPNDAPAPCKRAVRCSSGFNFSITKWTAVLWSPKSRRCSTEVGRSFRLLAGMLGENELQTTSHWSAIAIPLFATILLPNQQVRTGTGRHATG